MKESEKSLKNIINQCCRELEKIFDSWCNENCIKCNDPSSKKYAKYYNIKDFAGCCTRCSKNKGYFNRSYIDNNFGNFLKENNFNIETGFFSKKEGCILPRNLRSLVCNFFTCNKFDFDTYYNYEKKLRTLRKKYEIAKRKLGEYV